MKYISTLLINIKAFHPFYLNIRNVKISNCHRSIFTEIELATLVLIVIVVMECTHDAS